MGRTGCAQRAHASHAIEQCVETRQQRCRAMRLQRVRRGVAPRDALECDARASCRVGVADFIADVQHFVAAHAGLMNECAQATRLAEQRNAACEMLDTAAGVRAERSRTIASVLDVAIAMRMPRAASASNVSSTPGNNATCATRGCIRRRMSIVTRGTFHIGTSSARMMSRADMPRSAGRRSGVASRKPCRRDASDSAARKLSSESASVPSKSNAMRR